MLSHCFSLAPFPGIATLRDRAVLGPMTQKAGPLAAALASSRALSLSKQSCTYAVTQLTYVVTRLCHIPTVSKHTLGLPLACLLSASPERSENGKVSILRMGTVLPQ